MLKCWKIEILKILKRSDVEIRNVEKLKCWKVEDMRGLSCGSSVFQLFVLELCNFRFEDFVVLKLLIFGSWSLWIFGTRGPKHYTAVPRRRILVPQMKRIASLLVVGLGLL